MNSSISISEKQRLLRKIAHLTKNKQQALSGGSYLLELGIKNNSPELIKKGWEIVQHNNQELSRCTSCLLLLSGESYSFEFFSLNSLITNAIEDFYSLKNQDSTQCEFVLDVPSITFQTDYSFLRIVLLKIFGLCDNLSTNLPPTKIKVEASQDRENLSLWFTPLQSPGNLTWLHDSSGQQSDDISNLEWSVIRGIIQEMQGTASIERLPQHDHHSITLHFVTFLGGEIKESKPIDDQHGNNKSTDLERGSSFDSGQLNRKTSGSS